MIGCLPGERYRPLALDLPGHGEYADSPRPISFAGCIAHVLDLAPARFSLCGYSLGGRIALHVALAAPERVSSLMLVSASPGIEDDAERAARRRADSQLARELEHGSLADFIARWDAQPLFVDDPPDVHRLAREDQLRNRADALAAVMRGIGAGEMTPLWNRLGELQMALTVLVGERDAKYRRLGSRIVELRPTARLVVVPGGHRLALESPAAVAEALTESTDRSTDTQPAHGRFTAADGGRP